MSQVWRRTSSLAFTFTLLAAGSAQANGRLPNTTFVRVNPADPNDMVLGATYGLLLSRNGGHSFNYVCEQAVTPPDGFGGADPIVNWAATGTITVASFAAVSSSRDHGCTWQTVNMFGNLNVADLSPQPDQSGTWYVAANDPNAAGSIYRTTDDGKTYQALPLAAAGVFWESIRAAPSMPKRLYAAGFKNNTFAGPYIARSDDGGTTWTTTLMTVASGGPAMVSAQTLIVHPTDPNVVFVAATDVANSNVALLRSADGGKTATLVQHINDIFRDLVFADDGKMAWLSTGARISRSTDGGLTFTLLPSPTGDACLTRVGKQLFACGNPQVDHFSLATSSDNGDTWQPLFSTNRLNGPWACGAGTSVQMSCQQPWLLIAGPLGAPQKAPAGTTGGDTQGSTTGATDATPTPPKSGCGGCAAGSPGLGAAAVLLALARVRRRKP